MQLLFIFFQNLRWGYFVILIIAFQMCVSTQSAEIQRICGSHKGDINATSSTAFVPNFIDVMEILQTKVTKEKWGQVSITSPAPAVYALAQCNADLKSVDCNLCFSQGRAKLALCLPTTAARIYLDGCFIRYDDYNFFNESVNSAFDYVNCSQPTGILSDNSLHLEFKKKVIKVIRNVTENTLAQGTFATVEAKQGAVPVYALAQCWNSVTYSECRDCLVMAGSELKECAPGAGQALFTGCYMKYSLEKFFNISTDSKNHDDDAEGGLVGPIVLAAIAFIVLSSFGAFLGYERLSTKKEDEDNNRQLHESSNLNFKYEVLEKATNYFNDEMKLGQGGAGSVYKGSLTDGRVVAVKRLVYNTRQWVDQFFNEINLISGIQHKNLVRLLGCSIEGPESLLVYEYVPNRSLDQILFMKSTIQILSWQQRYQIILGTAEGLAYLHGGCGVTIIHRDIKTSNVLLDEMLIPKIADFGLARCFAPDNTHMSTGIAGTLGYMAPEYLIRGQLTEKADVYGFGVLVLEIATGKKNSVYSQGSGSILHNVWKQFKSRTLIQAMDARIPDRTAVKIAENVLQIGLLCTQASPALRPSMADVVEMLTNEDSVIPTPRQPPFLNASVLTADASTKNSITKVSLTEKLSMTLNRPKMLTQLSSDVTQNSFKTAKSGWSSSSIDQPDETKYFHLNV
ncbi:cysteine-rich receptor-like protein kinase 1 [Mercurialis annua]|uniref:cysteine-rich receptor-like protein kinase 1 n=1 Tax=Mercurialis annua TaxID=3986 RepID=UPI0021607727|nr:cysteine-rich receptor-like protein kinase 1 [Mercurialis annua]XP_050225434.1 cysteine-rich receptor-like protein kinase 1 [Mercurialis annua]